MRSRIKAPSGASLLLLAGVSTIPIYSVESGGMQLSHILLFIFSALYIAKHGWGKHVVDLLLTTLVGFALVREALAVAGGAAATSFLSVAHILYVAVLVNALRRALAQPSRFKMLVYGVFVAMFLATAGVLLLGYGLTIDAEGGRAIGTFNNPNQLGYFAVCSACIGVLFKQRNEIGLKALAGILAASMFLAAASLSKASMICVFAVVVLSGYVMAPRRGLVIVGLMFFTVSSVGAWALYDSGAFDGYAFVQRLQRLGTQEDDSLIARGYGIFDGASVVQLFSGLGSAAVHDIRGREIHSTIFSFFGNYGIAGGALFFFVLIVWAIRVRTAYGWLGVALLVVPPMAYGVTHNGSRFVIFWLLVCACMARSEADSMSSWRSAGGSSTLIGRGSLRWK